MNSVWALEHRLTQDIRETKSPRGNTLAESWLRKRRPLPWTTFHADQNLISRIVYFANLAAHRPGRVQTRRGQILDILTYNKRRPVFVCHDLVAEWLAS